jgi:hypothetical protein
MSPSVCRLTVVTLDEEVRPAPPLPRGARIVIRLRLPRNLLWHTLV